MTKLLSSDWLLADVGLFRSMNQQFSGQNFRFGWTHLLVILLVIAAVTGGFWLLNRLARSDGQRVHHSPQGLFRELCRAHGLSLTNRRLLDQLARHQSLSDPARLFLEPERFEASQLGPLLEAHHARFAAIRDRIFANKDAPARSNDDDR